MSTLNLIQKRDRKVRQHLAQYAPVWLTEENVLQADEAVQFGITFQHKDYGWVKRRYYYDGFNNVLYYRGQTVLTEDQVVILDSQEPYIDTLVPDAPNSYGG